MNFIRRLLIVFVFLIPSVHAAEKPLTIAINRFHPPFSMQGSNNESYDGFDVEMMQSLCKIMQRTCHFHAMEFEQLLPAVENQEADLAVSYITITHERAKRVNFSVPYLLSYSQFLTKHSESGIKEPFQLDLLNNKSIGIVKGTIFSEQIKAMNIKNPTIKEYDSTELLVENLDKKNVDFIMVNSPTAKYWEANSSGKFYTIGPSFIYGYGVGIAVNLKDTNLLSSLNKALMQYHSSEDFKHNYDKFIFQF